MSDQEVTRQRTRTGMMPPGQPIRARSASPRIVNPRPKRLILTDATLNQKPKFQSPRDVPGCRPSVSKYEFGEGGTLASDLCDANRKVSPREVYKMGKHTGLGPSYRYLGKLNQVGPVMTSTALESLYASRPNSSEGGTVLYSKGTSQEAPELGSSRTVQMGEEWDVPGYPRSAPTTHGSDDMAIEKVNSTVEFSSPRGIKRRESEGITSPDRWTAPKNPCVDHNPNQSVPDCRFVKKSPRDAGPATSVDLKYGALSARTAPEVSSDQPKSRDEFGDRGQSRGQNDQKRDLSVKFRPRIPTLQLWSKDHESSEPTSFATAQIPMRNTDRTPSPMSTTTAGMHNTDRTLTPIPIAAAEISNYRAHEQVSDCDLTAQEDAKMGILYHASGQARAGYPSEKTYSNAPRDTPLHNSIFLKENALNDGSVSPRYHGICVKDTNAELNSVGHIRHGSAKDSGEKPYLLKSSVRNDLQKSSVQNVDTDRVPRDSSADTLAFHCNHLEIGTTEAKWRSNESIRNVFRAGGKSYYARVPQPSIAPVHEGLTEEPPVKESANFRNTGRSPNHESAPSNANRVHEGDYAAANLSPNNVCSHPFGKDAQQVSTWMVLRHARAAPQVGSKIASAPTRCNPNPCLKIASAPTVIAADDRSRHDGRLRAATQVDKCGACTHAPSIVASPPTSDNRHNAGGDSILAVEGQHSTSGSGKNHLRYADKHVKPTTMANRSSFYRSRSEPHTGAGAFISECRPSVSRKFPESKYGDSGPEFGIHRSANSEAALPSAKSANRVERTGKGISFAEGHDDYIGSRGDYGFLCESAIDRGATYRLPSCDRPDSITDFEDVSDSEIVNNFLASQCPNFRTGEGHPRAVGAPHDYDTCAQGIHQEPAIPGAKCRFAPSHGASFRHDFGRKESSSAHCMDGQEHNMVQHADYSEQPPRRSESHFQDASLSTPQRPPRSVSFAGVTTVPNRIAQERSRAPHKVSITPARASHKSLITSIRDKEQPSVLSSGAPSVRDTSREESQRASAAALLRARASSYHDPSEQLSLRKWPRRQASWPQLPGLYGYASSLREKSHSVSGAFGAHECASSGHTLSNRRHLLPVDPLHASWPQLPELYCYAPSVRDASRDKSHRASDAAGAIDGASCSRTAPRQQSLQASPPRQASWQQLPELVGYASSAHVSTREKSQLVEDVAGARDCAGGCHTPLQQQTPRTSSPRQAPPHQWPLQYMGAAAAREKSLDAADATGAQGGASWYPTLLQPQTPRTSSPRQPTLQQQTPRTSSPRYAPLQQQTPRTSELLARRSPGRDISLGKQPRRATEVAPVRESAPSRYTRLVPPPRTTGLVRTGASVRDMSPEKQPQRATEVAAARGAESPCYTPLQQAPRTRELARRGTSVRDVSPGKQPRRETGFGEVRKSASPRYAPLLQPPRTTGMAFRGAVVRDMAHGEQPHVTEAGAARETESPCYTPSLATPRTPELVCRGTSVRDISREKQLQRATELGGANESAPPRCVPLLQFPRPPELVRRDASVRDISLEKPPRRVTEGGAARVTESPCYTPSQQTPRTPELVRRGASIRDISHGKQPRRATEVVAARDAEAPCYTPSLETPRTQELVRRGTSVRDISLGGQLQRVTAVGAVGQSASPRCAPRLQFPLTPELVRRGTSVRDISFGGQPSRVTHVGAAHGAESPCCTPLQQTPRTPELVRRGASVRETSHGGQPHRATEVGAARESESPGYTPAPEASRTPELFRRGASVRDISLGGQLQRGTEGGAARESASPRYTPLLQPPRTTGLAHRGAAGRDISLGAQPRHVTEVDAARRNAARCYTSLLDCPRTSELVRMGAAVRDIRREKQPQRATEVGAVRKIASPRYTPLLLTPRTSEHVRKCVSFRDAALEKQPQRTTGVVAGREIASSRYTSLQQSPLTSELVFASKPPRVSNRHSPLNALDNSAPACPALSFQDTTLDTPPAHRGKATILSPPRYVEHTLSLRPTTGVICDSNRAASRPHIPKLAVIGEISTCSDSVYENECRAAPMQVTSSEVTSSSSSPRADEHRGGDRDMAAQGFPCFCQGNGDASDCCPCAFRERSVCRNGHNQSCIHTNQSYPQHQCGILRGCHCGCCPAPCRCKFHCEHESHMEDRENSTPPLCMRGASTHCNETSVFQSAHSRRTSACGETGAKGDSCIRDTRQIADISSWSKKNFAADASLYAEQCPIPGEGLGACAEERCWYAGIGCTNDPPCAEEPCCVCDICTNNALSAEEDRAHGPCCQHDILKIPDLSVPKRPLSITEARPGRQPATPPFVGRTEVQLAKAQWYPAPSIIHVEKAGCRSLGQGPLGTDWLPKYDIRQPYIETCLPPTETRIPLTSKNLIHFTEMLRETARIA